jgi:signal transduction histidine kinase
MVESPQQGNKKTVSTPGEVRVGHYYLDAQRKLLHCLNDTARQLISEGVPFTSADLAKQPLRTTEGKKVEKSELPLRIALRQEKPIQAEFLLSRDSLPPLQLRWVASPVRNGKGIVVGVMGTLIVGALEPDWQALAGMAHDLRTPLQSLGLLIELAEGSTHNPAEMAELLPRVRASAERSLSIAQQVLEWCRGPLRAGGDANREWLALEPFLTALAAEQAVAAKHKSLTLASNVAAAHEWEAYTDRVRLGRLLSNLLVNAIRYTKTGQVEFTAAWRDGRNGGLAPGRKLVLSIVDTGAGIPVEEQESIFQPFERGRAGKEGDSGGSGLGLAIVDRLIEELGLELEVYSEFGHGSAFHLLLPDSSLRQVSTL